MSEIILTLGVHKDSEIKIEAEGEDANAALTTLEELVNSNFGEED